MFQDSFLRELVVDNFAGGGGASTGIELALGRPVDIAINHDPDAILMHKLNHPYTQHYCESVWDINPPDVTHGRPVGLAWFSPDCKHFSKAKGGKPVDKKIRGLAWIALRWAGTVRPRVIILENVEEFQTWCPVRKGKPVKSKKGQTFQKFVAQLRALGYAVDWRELKACDYGAPTIRKRFFLIARCDGLPIVWAEPTHGKGKKPYRTAADIIDMTIPCRSIFEREKPLAEATMRRIARGQDKFVIHNPRPFIVQVNHSGEFRGQSVDEALPTLTAKNGIGIVNPHLVQIGQTGFAKERSSDIREPLKTIVSKNEHCFVNPCIVPVGYGERKGQAPRVNDSASPLSTVVGSCKQNLVAASLTKFQQNSVGQETDKPLDTVLAGAARFGLVEETLTPFVTVNTTGNVGNKIDEPTQVVTAVNKHFLAEPKLAPFVTVNNNNNVPSGMQEPLRTVTTGNRHMLTAPALIQYHSEQSPRETRGQKVDEPLQTVDSRNRYAVTAAHLDKYFGGNCQHGAPIDKPLPTVTAIDHNALCGASLVKYYGSGENAESMQEPLSTVTAKDRFGLAESHICVLRNHMDCKPLDAPLPTLTAAKHVAKIETRIEKVDGADDLGHWAEVRDMLNKYCDYGIADDEILILRTGGVDYFIADIGMRMLEPRELFNAQGVPPDYIIDIEQVTGRRYSKAKQVARCGNMVCPPIAEALVRANFKDIAFKRKIKTMHALMAAIEN